MRFTQLTLLLLLSFSSYSQELDVFVLDEFFNVDMHENAQEIENDNQLLLRSTAENGVLFSAMKVDISGEMGTGEVDSKNVLKELYRGLLEPFENQSMRGQGKK